MSDLELADLLEAELRGTPEELTREQYVCTHRSVRPTRFVKIAQPWEERRAQYLRETGRARQAKRRAA